MVDFDTLLVVLITSALVSSGFFLIGIVFLATDIGPLIYLAYQRGGQMDKTLGLSAGRSGIRIPGRGKCSLRTIAVDARVNYRLF